MSQSSTPDHDPATPTPETDAAGKPAGETSAGDTPDAATRPGTEAAPPGDTTQASEPPGQQQGSGLGAEQLRAMIEALTAENQKLNTELKDLRLRQLAEVDNLRKRLEREKAEAGKYAITKFAGDIVVVADNFERAVAAVPNEAIETDPALKSLCDGVSMTEREFLNILERHGVKRDKPEGEIFNPHRHQAVMETPNADVPAGTILQVYQPGYLIEDRVLRPAMVVVATGGPKPNKNTQQPPAEPGGPADQTNE